MSKTPENQAPNFNRLARAYRWLEYLSFGPFLWRCRVHFLSQLAECRHALVLGDGDGRFTAKLLRVIPEVRVHAIDASLRMIESLRQSAAPHRDRLTTEVADLRTWQPPSGEKYDLIVTHFFLDCLTTGEVAQLAHGISPFLTRNALWLVSEFAVPQTFFGRTIAAPLVTLLYRAFGWITGLRPQSLPDHDQALALAGWVPQANYTRLHGLLVSQLWRFSSDPAGPVLHPKPLGIRLPK